jgi:hypothetical protein
VKGTVSVTPSETLTVRVGGEPPGRTGGYNGGGNGAPGSNRTGGGGASDVRKGGDALSDRIIVAGGGGGGSAGTPQNVGSGGDGGGPNGGAGIFCNFPGCGGGSPTQGGKGGVNSGCGGPNGNDGKLGVGGDGGSGCGFFAGGGGGGLYGGGGGSTLQTVIELFGQTVQVTQASGGGGGSGFVTPTATNQSNQAGHAEAGNGEVTLTYTPGDVFEARFPNCDTLRVGYNRFINGTVVHWTVTTKGVVGTVASGQYNAIGGGNLGSKTYHFLDVPLGTTLKQNIQSQVTFTWAVNGRYNSAPNLTCE